jgi:hypothetical protein
MKRFGLLIATTCVMCAGCAQLLGLDETSGVQGRELDLQRTSIGSKVTIAPLVLASPPTFFDAVSSGVGVPGAAGTWTSPMGGPELVEYLAPDLPRPYRHAFALTTQTTRGNFYAFEHPNPDPAPDATLMLNITLPGAYAATQALEIDAIGAWTRHAVTDAELPIAGAMTLGGAFPYSGFVASTPSPRARITTDDTVVLLRYEAAQLTGELIVPAFDQVAGGTNTVSGTMDAVTPIVPFDATVMPIDAASRFAAAVPSTAAPSYGWQVQAAPGYSLGVATGITLATGAVAMGDTSFMAMYANPFATLGWKPILIYSAVSSRTFTVGGSAVTISDVLSTYSDPATGLTLDFPAGLPTAITVANTVLDTDGMTVSLDPSVPSPVGITCDRAGPTFYEAALEEITVVGATVTDTPVINLVSTASPLTIPAGIMQRGHTYTLVTICGDGGYTGAATGDFVTSSLPASVGRTTSAVFTVAP